MNLNTSRVSLKIFFLLHCWYLSSVKRFLTCLVKLRFSFIFRLLFDSDLFILFSQVLDMSVQCVSDMQTKRDSLFNLFESDSEAKRKFPGEQFVLHAEFANFFHPMSDSLPGEGI